MNESLESLSQDLTVVLGLFNAVPYLDSLKAQIESQRTQVSYLVIDNKSTDGTWGLLQKWSKTVNASITLVQNPINLGGTGTLLANLDLIRTPWVATLHQDDFYKPTHISTLAKAIAESNSDDIAFATDMGSMDNLGSQIACPPRASWTLNDYSPATMFLSNLQLHNFPFPAAAFRVSALESVSVPWHSTSFPDTEMVLKWALQGRINHLHGETMLYRENPASESHTVNHRERALGAYLSLSRIFGMPEFADLLKSIDEGRRSNYFEALQKAIGKRVLSTELADLLKLQVAEISAVSWGYSERRSNEIIIQASIATGAARTSTLVGDLNNFHNISSTNISGTKSFSEVEIEVAVEPSDASKRLIGLLGRLPYPLRKGIFRLLLRLFGRLNPDSPWNSEWK